jgi:hypothetical protein
VISLKSLEVENRKYMTGLGTVRGLAVFDRLARSRSEEVEQARVYAHSMIGQIEQREDKCLSDRC